MLWCFLPFIIILQSMHSQQNNKGEKLLLTKHIKTSQARIKIYEENGGEEGWVGRGWGIILNKDAKPKENLWQILCYFGSTQWRTLILPTRVFTNTVNILFTYAHIIAFNIFLKKWALVAKECKIFLSNTENPFKNNDKEVYICTYSNKTW